MLLDVIVAVSLLGFAEANWSEPVAVRSGNQVCVTYKAQIQGSYLVISADHEGPWHTYAMDNDVRAKEKLAGKPSLGVEEPTSIEVDGVSTQGAWLQTKPKDLSQPELRWYRWCFSDDALFAIKIDPATLGDEVTVNVTGQVCDLQRCLRVDAVLNVDQAARSSEVAREVGGLTPVKRKD